MFYREVGQFKTNYTADSQVFPILQDKVGIIAMLVIA
ncbi:MAG: branched-chain amino acid ABC transporter permease, partial [Pseudomonadota bacterium]